MILIVGGCCQGKAEYARSLMKQYQGVGAAGLDGGVGATDGRAGGSMAADGSMAGRGHTDGSMSDGRKDGWRQAPGRACLLNFHGFLRQVMETGLDPDAFTEEVLKSGPEIVTMDEVGCGIVPVEQSERDYREAVGRAGQRIAGAADEVYRMMCGIAVRIK